MKQALALIFAYMPFLFGIGFIAPLIAQMDALMTGDPWMSERCLAFGLVVGGAWGALATWQGRWL